MEIIIKYLNALLTPLLGIVATVVIILQYYLQKRRWRSDLYDKRYPVYIATQEFIASIIQRADITETDKQIYSFLRKSKDKEFLFGKDIQEYLNEIYNKALEYENIKRQIEDNPRGDIRNKLLETEKELLRWFANQFEICKKNFGKYLAIDKR